MNILFSIKFIINFLFSLYNPKTVPNGANVGILSDNVALNNNAQGQATINIEVIAFKVTKGLTSCQ